MCRQTSVLNKIAFAVLVLGCILSVISFGAPFWVRIPDNWSLMMWDKVTYRGLWGMCCPNTKQSSGYACVWVWYDYYSLEANQPPCTWVYTESFTSTNDIPSWYKAAEAIYCFALVFLFFAVLLQSIYNCCRCCKNPNFFPTAVAAMAFAGAIFVALSLGVYGGSSYKDGVFAPLLANGRGGQLEWAFYVGVAGAGTCFMAAVMFFIDGCIQTNHYRGYKSPVLGTQARR